MKKNSFVEKMQYEFDNLMSKGTIALVGILFLATAIVATLVGLILSIADKNNPSLGYNIWQSIMHIIDAGTITAADTSNIVFVVLMVIATICGLFVTSILIGIITTGFEEKLNSLKKGNSRVIENGHTVIIGFNSNIYTLISELIIANESKKKASIVILGTEDKETMETMISENIEDTKNTKIICRSGGIADAFMLGKCSIESANAIIINEEQDFLTIKSILSINNYLKNNCKKDNYPHLVSTMKEKENYDVSNIISIGNCELVLIEDFISRIIAQSCRQPGLSNVLIELFDYDGDELYFESFSECTGKKFGEVLNYFEKAIVFGISRGDEVFLNPDMNMLIQDGDELILLVEDDGMAKIKKIEHIKNDFATTEVECNESAETVLILGINSLLDNIVIELNDFFKKGSKIIIADESISNEDKLLKTYENVEIEYYECDIKNRKVLEDLLIKPIDHVLLLSRDDEDDETSDAKTLLMLIHIREIVRMENKKFNVTSELKKVENQKLAQIAKANDLVIGSNIINLILTQISENKKLSKVFNELLQAEGSEIHIRPASNYVKLNVEMDFYAVTEILKNKNEIAIGYKKQNENTFDIITNPLKSEKITFTSEDAIITLALE